MGGAAPWPINDEPSSRISGKCHSPSLFHKFWSFPNVSGNISESKCWIKFYNRLTDECSWWIIDIINENYKQYDRIIIKMINAWLFLCNSITFNCFSKMLQKHIILRCCRLISTAKISWSRWFVVRWLRHQQFPQKETITNQTDRLLSSGLRDYHIVL